MPRPNRDHTSIYRGIVRYSEVAGRCFGGAKGHCSNEIEEDACARPEMEEVCKIGQADFLFIQRRLEPRGWPPLRVTCRPLASRPAEPDDHHGDRPAGPYEKGLGWLVALETLGDRMLTERSRHCSQYPIPPMPPLPAGRAVSLEGMSAIIASAVIRSAAIEPASCKAVRTTFAGSTMPALIIST